MFTHPLQERFRNPLWSDVDRLAEYLQEALETVRAMRAGVPAAQHAQANRDMAAYTSLLVLFAAACGFLYVLPSPSLAHPHKAHHLPDASKHLVCAHQARV
jgi:hypothetical protein